MILERINREFGFDTNNKDNGRQNSYAWAMCEFGDYIYVGTGRNVAYVAFKTFGFEVPDVFIPEKLDLNTEIWRYKKGGSNNWELVYKSPNELLAIGIREMIVYTDKFGEAAIYGGMVSSSNDDTYLIKSVDGRNWEIIKNILPGGFNTRSMGIYNNKLYIGATDSEHMTQDTYLYVSDDPANEFKQINLTSNCHTNPKGEIVSIANFNNALYFGTATIGGFEVWKSNDPDSGIFELVVDKGAGDELNEVPISMAVHNNHLYVGSAIWYGIRSVDPAKGFVPIKGFDMIKIDKDDNWELVVGSDPILPTNPTKGIRNKAKYESGFGNIYNDYCWRMVSYNESLYISSWDSQVVWKTLSKWAFEGNDTKALAEYISKILEKYMKNPYYTQFNHRQWLESLFKSIHNKEGFDFFKLNTLDNGEIEMISNNGFGNIYNYGIRTLVSATDGYLYIGTANPYNGCEVWKLHNCKHKH